MPYRDYWSEFIDAHIALLVYVLDATDNDDNIQFALTHLHNLLAHNDNLDNTPLLIVANKQV